MGFVMGNFPYFPSRLHCSRRNAHARNIRTVIGFSAFQPKGANICRRTVCSSIGFSSFSLIAKDVESQHPFLAIGVFCSIGVLCALAMKIKLKEKEALQKKLDEQRYQLEQALILCEEFEEKLGSLYGLEYENKELREILEEKHESLGLSRAKMSLMGFEIEKLRYLYAEKGIELDGVERELNDLSFAYKQSQETVEKLRDLCSKLEAQISSILTEFAEENGEEENQPDP